MSVETRRGRRWLNKGPVDVGAPLSHANPEIGASWQRSLAHGVPQDRFPAVPLAEYDPDSRLLRAARPVLERLESSVLDASMSLILTDGNACIVDRRVGRGKLIGSLDGATVVPGAVYSEATVGTNALGLAIETKHPVSVLGADHFTETLRSLTCVAVPIVNPIDTRLEGVLDITCSGGTVSPLMLPVLLEASMSIHEMLAGPTSRTDQLLLQEFHDTARRHQGAVLLLKGDLVMANAKAAALLQPDDQDLLRHLSREIAGSSPRSVELSLNSGAMVVGTFRPVIHQSKVIGTIIHLADAESRVRIGRGKPMTHLADALPDLVGRSSSWEGVCHTIRSQMGNDVALALLGEPGVGKFSVAAALHQLRKDHDPTIGPLEIVEASLALSDHTGWLSTLKGALGKSATVVLRHVDSLPPDLAAAAGAIIADRHEEARICATAGEGWYSSAPRVLVDQFPLVVNLPALRHRLEDLPDLIEAILRRHGADTRSLHVTSETIALLRRSAWPGNLRELEKVLTGLLTRRSKGAIIPDDLPASYKVSSRRATLTLMEEAEYEAIVRALAKCHGNKCDVATELGISRSTLYRKLKAYSITDLQTY